MGSNSENENCLPKEEKKHHRCVLGLAAALISLNVLCCFATTRPIELHTEVTKDKKAPANKDSESNHLGENF